MITCNDDDAVQSLVFLLFVYFPSSSLLTVAVMSDFVNTRMISVMVFVSESHSLRTFLSGILFGMSFHPSLHETCCLVFFSFSFQSKSRVTSCMNCCSLFHYISILLPLFVAIFFWRNNILHEMLSLDLKERNYLDFPSGIPFSNLFFVFLARFNLNFVLF